MKKILKNKTAFSLIELSIVLLIIGIVVAGVTQSSRLISAFRLSSARSLTQSSPVASITNLSLWYDTTSAASFSESQAEDTLTATTWNDINPQSTTKRNATGVGATYTANCLNSLPCLRFNGSSHTFSYDGTFLAGTDYTVIVVEQRRSSGSTNLFLAGTSLSTNNNLILGYGTNTTISFSQYANDLSVTVAAYSSPIPRIHAFTFNSATGKTHYLNGALSTFNANSASQTTGITSYSGAAIGYYGGGGNYYYSGDIFEIIMFNRALKTEERRAIEAYLGKKWGITVI